MDVKTFVKPTRSAFAFALFATLAACAPNPNGMGVADFGTVSGRVVDTKTQQPINSATIAIGNVVYITTAADQGGFVLHNVPVGTNMIRFSAIGWVSFGSQVTVVKDQNTDVGLIGLTSTIQQ